MRAGAGPRIGRAWNGRKCGACGHPRWRGRTLGRRPVGKEVRLDGGPRGVDWAGRRTNVPHSTPHLSRISAARSCPPAACARGTWPLRGEARVPVSWMQRTRSVIWWGLCFSQQQPSHVFFSTHGVSSGRDVLPFRGRLYKERGRLDFQKFVSSTAVWPTRSREKAKTKHWIVWLALTRYVYEPRTLRK